MEHMKDNSTRFRFRQRRRAAVARPLPHDVAVRPDPELSERLRQLHDDYIWDVNSALEGGREDLARDLSDAYADDALLVLGASAEVHR